MDQRFGFLCQPQTRRLLWLMGITAAIVLAVQYFELPCGSALSSLSSAGKVSSNTIDTSVVPETAISSGASDTTDGTVERNESKGQERGFNNDFVSERNGSLISSAFGLVNNQTSFDDLVQLNKSSVFQNVGNSENGAVEEKASELEHGVSLKNVNTSNTSSSGSVRVIGTDLKSGKIGSSNAALLLSSFALPPISSLPNKTLFTNLGLNSTTHAISVNSKTSSTDQNETSGVWQGGNGLPNNSSSSSSMTRVPVLREKRKKPPKVVVSISAMNNLLQQSHASFHSMGPKRSSTVDQELLLARSQMENAPIMRKDKKLYAPLYRNVSMFKRSYELMESTLKAYIYREGEKPIFHHPILEGIYASEGWFLKLMEENKHFVTADPGKAHLFYLPFSSRQLELTLYVRNSHRRDNLIRHLKNYVDMIAAKYPFWNRTSGADHFLVACHDWAPAETRGVMLNCIRALCNADVNVGFKIGKDVSLPEVYVRSAPNPLKNLGGNPPSRRPILAFFAGNRHGYIRPILLKYWENKDPDMKIFGPMPHARGNMNYIRHMKSSKFCICAKGYEVNSPRVVEAIFYECVPVIISDNFVPPFFDVLNWESFAVFIPEKDIPNLKNILLSISEEKYMQMQKRVKKVQHHFLWHAQPVRYDMFHMILHSIWYNRVFQINPT